MWDVSEIESGDFSATSFKLKESMELSWSSIAINELSKELTDNKKSVVIIDINVIDVKKFENVVDDLRGISALIRMRSGHGNVLSKKYVFVFSDNAVVKDILNSYIVKTPEQTLPPYISAEAFVSSPPSVIDVDSLSAIRESVLNWRIKKYKPKDPPELADITSRILAKNFDEVAEIAKHNKQDEGDSEEEFGTPLKNGNGNGAA